MKKSEVGQALLIILLVMAVGLTISLSLISRSITDIRISQQEEESARAFSVAEAGLEESLKAGSATSVTIGNITATVTEIAQGGGAEFVFSKEIDAGDTQTVWLVEHDSGGLNPGISYGGSWIEVYWGNEGQAASEGTTPALEVIIIYDDGGFKVFRATFDPNSGRTATNKFGNAQIGPFVLSGQSFQFKGRIPSLPSGTLYALRLRLFYNTEAQALGASGNANFPSQGGCYVSTATVPESDITRKVRQCQSHKVPPAIFDYVLFSKGDLAK